MISKFQSPNVNAVTSQSQEVFRRV